MLGTHKFLFSALIKDKQWLMEVCWCAGLVSAVKKGQQQCACVCVCVCLFLVVTRDKMGGKS